MNTKNTSIRKFKRAQGGWTFWGLAFVLSVLGLFAYVTMQLVPVYSANRNVQNAMQVALNNADTRAVSRANIIRGMKAQLYLDGNDKLIDFKKDLKVRKKGQNIILEVNYSQEVPLFYNLSLKAQFDNTAQRKIAGG